MIDDVPSFSIGLTQVESEAKKTAEPEKEKEESITVVKSKRKDVGKSKNKEQNETKETEVVIRHISLPTKIIQFVNSLKEHEKKEERFERIRRAGFGGMLVLTNLLTIPNYFLNWVLKNFDAEGNMIRLEGESVLPLTSDDVLRVYGLPQGPKKIDLEKEKKESRDRLREALEMPDVKKGDKSTSFKIGSKIACTCKRR